MSPSAQQRRCWRWSRTVVFERPSPRPPVQRREVAVPLPPLLTLLLVMTAATLSAGVTPAVAVVADAAPAAAAASTCSSFARYYANLGYNSLDAPRTAPIPGDTLAVCPSSAARCCTLKSEKNLVLSSKKWLSSGVSPAMHTARAHLHKLSVETDAFFALLLQRAHKELHEMFTRAYGVQYLQNAEVFDRLFARFRGYYGGSDENLESTVRGFFADIFSRMYKMINAGDRSVTTAYLDNCVGGRLEQLAPFGEMPAQLGLGVRRALVVARTFMQGLSVGHHAFLTALNWAQNPGTQCLHTVTRMLHCPYCTGDVASTNTSDQVVQRTPLTSQPGQLACHAGCVAAVRRCFSPSFIDGWDKYASAMDAVGSRLEDEGAFNIEAVLGPLKDSISAAIMDYNTNHGEIEKKIVTIPGCQKGSGGQRMLVDAPEQRGKRSSSAHRGKPSTASESRRAPGPVRKLHPGAEQAATSEQTLRRLVADVRMHLRRLRSMWKTLENQFCNPAMGVAASSNDSCIDTSSSNGNESLAVAQQSSPGLNSSELSLDSASASGTDELLLANATRLLRIVTAHLNEAVGEQRSIVWLRLPSATNQVAAGPSDDAYEGSGAPRRQSQHGVGAAGSSTAARGSGDGGDADGDDDDDNSDGSGSGGGAVTGNQNNSWRPTRPSLPGRPQWPIDGDDDDDYYDDGEGSGGRQRGRDGAAARPLPLPPSKTDGERPPMRSQDQPPKQQPKLPNRGATGSGDIRSAAASSGVLAGLLTCSALHRLAI